MRRILREHLTEVEVLGLDDVAPYDEPVEDQPTFEGNALLKARAGVASTGLPTLADDSGLCVDALNGMPGVLSARWSGPPLSRQGRTSEQRAAPRAARGRARRASYGVLHAAPSRWSCPTARVRIVEGRMDGRIVREVRGSGGFGYDVVFEADDRPGVTTAELASADKDEISHRGKALREIAPVVADLLR